MAISLDRNASSRALMALILTDSISLLSLSIKVIYNVAEAAAEATSLFVAPIDYVIL